MGDAYGPMIVYNPAVSGEWGEVSRAKTPPPKLASAATLRDAHGDHSPLSKAKPSPSPANAPPPGSPANSYSPSTACRRDDINYQVVMFDEILPRVESGDFDAGLIIHEGQITYQNNGLRATRRSRPVVDRFASAPAAAGRQRHPTRPRRVRRSTAHLSRAARFHRVRFSAPRRGGGLSP